MPTSSTFEPRLVAPTAASQPAWPAPTTITSYSGNIGLVVSADDALENPVENPIIKSVPERFREKGLADIYYESMGEKICEFHKNVIHDELPEFESKYRDITLIDRVLGVKCPIDEKLGGKKRG